MKTSDFGEDTELLSLVEGRPIFSHKTDDIYRQKKINKRHGQKCVLVLKQHTSNWINSPVQIIAHTWPLGQHSWSLLSKFWIMFSPIQ